MSTLIEYYNALERLKAGKPQIVPQGTKITKDAVSLEAGRGKGTIKKPRVQFAELIRQLTMQPRIKKILSHLQQISSKRPTVDAINIKNYMKKL